MAGQGGGVSGAAGGAAGGAGEGTLSGRRRLRRREALVPAAGKERLGADKMADGELNVDSLITRLLEVSRMSSRKDRTDD